MMMKNRIIMAGVVGIVLLCSPETYAGLRWEQRRVEPAVRLSDMAVEAGFAFRNAGETPVTITDVRTSCGCTAALEEKTCAPGESGRIDVRFRFGARTGLSRQTATVIPDPRRHPATPRPPERPRTPLVRRAASPEGLNVHRRVI